MKGPSLAGASSLRRRRGGSLSNLVRGDDVRRTTEPRHHGREEPGLAVRTANAGSPRSGLGLFGAGPGPRPGSSLVGVKEPTHSERCFCPQIRAGSSSPFPVLRNLKPSYDFRRREGTSGVGEESVRGWRRLRLKSTR